MTSPTPHYRLKRFDFELAFDMANSGIEDISALIDPDHPRVLTDVDEDEESMEAFETLVETERGLFLPSKYELNLGTSLVFEFVETHLPEHEEKIRGFFRKRGACGRMKDFLMEIGRLEDWYAFEEKARREAFDRWAEEHGVEWIEEDPPPGADEYL